MRRGIPFVCLGLLAAPASGQGPDLGRWFAGPTEYHGNKAWVFADVGGERIEAGVLCAADQAYFHFNVPNATWWSYDQHLGRMVLGIDDRTFAGDARYLASNPEPTWAMPIGAAEAEALSQGNRLSAEILGLGAVPFGLRGSSAAIAQALEGCGAGRGLNPDWDTYFALFAPDAAGTMRPVAEVPGIVNVSAGHAEPGDEPAPDAGASEGTTDAFEAMATRQIQEACGGKFEAPAATFRTVEVDGDGAPDLLVDWTGIQCTQRNVGRGAGFCGMQACRHDIYASSVWQPGQWPQSINAITVQEGEPGSGVALRSTRMETNCAFAEVCETQWRWTGSRLEAAK